MRLLEDYADLQAISSCDVEPDLIERTAMGTVIQEFCQGIEGIFLTVAKHADCRTPTSAGWHRERLGQLVTGTDSRPAHCCHPGIGE